MKVYKDMNRRQERMVGSLVILIILFILGFAIFGSTAYQFISVLVGTSILVVMWLLHHENVKEDEARGICKGRNRVGSVYLSGGLICYTGIHILIERWDGFSITDPFHLIGALLILFIILRGWICIRAGSEYNKTIDRLEEHELQLKRLGYELDIHGRLHRVQRETHNKATRE